MFKMHFDIASLSHYAIQIRVVLWGVRLLPPKLGTTSASESTTASVALI